MSGHSKWSKIKHQKETADASKGKLFTKLTSAIIIAVKESGNSDPESNFKLRLAIEKGKSFNMPKENILRAIEKGKGSGDSQNLQQVMYEAFGPKGVGIIIEAATDNRQRTIAEIKNVLERGGGVLTASGAVSHFFQYVGLISIVKGSKSYDEIMETAVNTGAIDIEDIGDTVEIYTEPKDLHRIKEEMVKKGMDISSFELYYRPLNIIAIASQDDAKSILRLMSNLENIEDVQKVSANFDIPDKFLVQS